MALSSKIINWMRSCRLSAVQSHLMCTSLKWNVHLWMCCLQLTGFILNSHTWKMCSPLQQENKHPQWTFAEKRVSTNTHTHTRLTALFPGLPGWAGTRKVKPIWILLKQETVSSWAICKSASRSRQITMPVLHHSKVFLQAGCPSCRPTTSVKALKAVETVLLFVYFCYQ